MCYTMDERTYLQAMLDNVAREHVSMASATTLTVSPIHQRSDPDQVSNGFTFRGAEKMHAILAANGQADMPVWATEFNWLRKSTDDGINCGDDY